MTGKKIVVLGTGGTIAGTARDAHDNVGYTAAQVGVEQLLAAIPGLATLPVAAEQVAQIDSKDMDTDTWARLAQRCAHWLAQADVAGIVITHGTDTLEETAFFLQAVLAATKPVVLTCAMRPATALAPDGPQNVLDAVAVASTSEAQGVVVVCAGKIHAAVDVAKQHTYRVDAFSSGDAGPVGYVEEGQIRLLRNWPQAGGGLPAGALQAMTRAKWPRVEIVVSHGGASGRMVEALLAQGIDGLVVAATGNGTVHRQLEAALVAAQSSGVKVLRATRCAEGRVIARPDDVLPGAAALSPVKARIALMLELFDAGA